VDLDYFTLFNGIPAELQLENRVDSTCSRVSSELVYKLASLDHFYQDTVRVSFLLESTPKETKKSGVDSPIAV